jgi:voltage-gated potassium channel Kch
MVRTRPGPLRLIVGGVAAALQNQRVRLLMQLTGSVILIATIFYRWVEGWGWLDALFFSVVTISTVGYGELVPETAAGKIFTMVYIFCGIGLFVAAAGAMADELIRRTRARAEEGGGDEPDA